MTHTPASSSSGDEGPLTRGQWLVLIAAFLGWMFDGLELGLFPIAAPPALRDLMSRAAEASQIAQPTEGDLAHYYSWLVALFLVGAAVGGWVFGWLGDRVGRVKAMALSIAVYSVFTGACALAVEPWHLAACRFLAALGMGGEWALGVALVMECWPEKYRPILAGAIGAAANLGFLLISLVGATLPITPQRWRWIMMVGAAPALLALLVLFFIPESKKWRESVGQGAKANPLLDVFSPRLVGRTLLGMALASVALIGTWGAFSAFLPGWVDQMVGKDDPLAKGRVQTVIALGAIAGAFLGPMAARWLGRRWSYFLLCLGSLAACQLLFRTFDSYGLGFVGVVGAAGLLSASFYGWLPLYLPELFPTRVRATGQGIAYNTGRVFAAMGAVTSGCLIKDVFGGRYPEACATVTLVYVAGMIVIWLAPETKGKPLPE
ncbi:MAG TPA: MFS transporter [Thermoguttaceae bacterium]|nr:MFS transporter [Thermoguttaceae bacterium]